ncbi:seven-hairpin glycosidase [Auriculariales sp. MPI-PUGE-AT-0066]|nr:seven-hairpin glycosidase [Auriculariales sp. MPI-PUGE-AT-0066]
MRHSRNFAGLVVFATLATARDVQKAGLTVPAEYAESKESVVRIFTDAFAAYEKYAWGHDDVKPVSGSFLDSRNGWGASIVDAMSTMLVMDLKDQYAKALEYAVNIDFDKPNVSGPVSVFETTIRYLGGMLSAYELNSKLNGQKDEALVKKAQQVADNMAHAWVGDQTVPWGWIDFTNNTPKEDNSNIAEAGTLIMEWGKLSEYSGNKTYLELAEKSFRQIATNNGTLFPGLAGQGINPRDGSFSSKYITWGGASDSYFEYLIKYARLTNNADPLWVQQWKLAVDSSIEHLMSRTTVGNWLMLGDMDEDLKLRHIGSHLACFHGGNWILGGQMLNNDTIVKYGLELTDACINTYAGTATNIGPDGFAYISEDGDFTGGSGPSDEQKAFNDEHGFYVTSGQYLLRPEVMESNFYAWRATGDTKYLDNAAAFVKKIEQYLKVSETGGYASLQDVNVAPPNFIDDTESFFFAEVMKYLFLTFDSPDHINMNEWVFNTEAHPFIAPEALESYEPGHSACKSKKAKKARRAKKSRIADQY